MSISKDVIKQCLISKQMLLKGHNSTMAHIDYLKNVQDVESINLEAMYNNYIAKWNADRRTPMTVSKTVLSYPSSSLWTH